MADVGSVTNFNSSLPNPLATLTSVMGIANASQQNQLLQTYNQQRQLEFHQGQANDLLTSVAALVNKPGITQSDVLGTLADRARQLGINGLPAYGIAAQRYQGPDWQNNLKIDATRAVGVPGITDRTGVVSPTTGATSSIPSTSAIGQGLQTGVPTGFTDVATGPAGAAGISNMAAMANDAPNQRSLLENLNSLGNEAVSGPSSDFEKRANALAQRLFPGKGVTLSTQQLANSEEYGKISEQLAGQQATAAHSTNAFLTNAYNTNPSLYLSKVGRQGITHMLQGNLDSVVAKNDAWDSYANGESDGQMHSPAEFTTWNRQFNANFNPRAFQYARMTPEERSNFRSTIPANQQQKFFNQIQDYQSKGWIDINPVPQSEQGKMPGMSGR